MISQIPYPKPPLFSIPILRRLPLGFRKPLLTFLTLITYIPILAFSQTHIATLMTVTGASMYPLLNTDHNRTTQRDVVFVDLRNPGENLKRGMVVAFWLVGLSINSAHGRVLVKIYSTVTTKKNDSSSVANIESARAKIQVTKFPRETCDQANHCALRRHHHH